MQDFMKNNDWDISLNLENENIDEHEKYENVQGITDKVAKHAVKEAKESRETAKRTEKKKDKEDEPYQAKAQNISEKLNFDCEEKSDITPGFNIAGEYPDEQQGIKNGSQTLAVTDISMVENDVEFSENKNLVNSYMAISSMKTWYVGCILEIISTNYVKMKFLKRNGSTFRWPRTAKIELVYHKSFLTPVTLQGDGKFIIHPGIGVVEKLWKAVRL
ncbi:unnamed protein product [Brassicogethes aeneus]|uniref:Uncharacterized protein n=1 Tax=Brassicogethes aeneus TaxID=1431903 RepID=A0A9P0BF56_BRAAE|nr:unnamed protein product [Brassicogethes aeneus]